MPLIDRRTLLVSAGSAAAVASLPRFAYAAPPDGPMAARIEPVTENFFGKTVTDPYRWMENAKDRDWEPFMKSQAAYTRRVPRGGRLREERVAPESGKRGREESPNSAGQCAG